MEDRGTARMRKYGESKTTRIMMATVPHVTSGLGLRKFQADGFLLTRVYKNTNDKQIITQNKYLKPLNFTVIILRVSCSHKILNYAIVKNR